MLHGLIESCRKVGVFKPVRTTCRGLSQNFKTARPSQIPTVLGISMHLTSGIRKWFHDPIHHKKKKKKKMEGLEAHMIDANDRTLLMVTRIHTFWTHFWCSMFLLVSIYYAYTCSNLHLPELFSSSLLLILLPWIIKIKPFKLFQPDTYSLTHYPRLCLAAILG